MCRRLCPAENCDEETNGVNPVFAVHGTSPFLGQKMCASKVQCSGNVYRILAKSDTMDIREIAKRAKVSTATVSRTINHVPTVDRRLAKRVWKVVEELGYYPN